MNNEIFFFLSGLSVGCVLAVASFARALLKSEALERLIKDAIKNTNNELVIKIAISEEECDSSLLKERNDTIIALRDLCGKFGDNDWDDDLYIADIIEKHLRRSLERRCIYNMEE